MCQGAYATCVRVPKEVRRDSRFPRAELTGQPPNTGAKIQLEERDTFLTTMPSPQFLGQVLYISPLFSPVSTQLHQLLKIKSFFYGIVLYAY